MEPPVCTRAISNSTSATFTCKSQAYKDNACVLEKIIMTCVAPSDEQKTVVTEVLIQDSPTRPSIRVDVRDLSPSTQYSCSAVLVNTAGPSKAGSSVDIQTFIVSK